MYVKDSYLSKQLCFLLYVTSKEVIKKYTYYLKEHDLTYTSFMVVMAIEDDEKINIKSLGQRVFLDSGTLTPLLKKLEKKGYVKRMREKEDERNLQISLTENGKKIKPVLESISEQVFEDFNFSKEEETELVHSLRHVITNNFANASE
ncbi:MarR family transcriptional regulator [Staphylococcus sp. NRL 16/872]|uniref:MarR family winged helix-turn-helix transcriptional regulator n=1 Tax=Staphylococcus sp. NRL 16/872 TaxID=2930131 RepID=UPI001FB3E64A|nr:MULTISPECIES: MarR family transcriptional regulator [unclassified Staphylococcus]MCJ1655679.1 MarR family transcriptional regulator [Staphylococcus sp. NRL 21/187]MCJ1661497.1 MarR family transcriptional regulator [Staphylococcus sp. NRL 18/288]MCJ1667407.1 MarR family transcriptional regulator [Staphylococcus sp. NRL 19/737]WEN69889.1 MarR family transcriptional regulator [Staphylococcus sp. NRL 16/872]